MEQRPRGLVPVPTVGPHARMHECQNKVAVPTKNGEPVPNGTGIRVGVADRLEVGRLASSATRI